MRKTPVSNRSTIRRDLWRCGLIVLACATVFAGCRGGKWDPTYVVTTGGNPDRGEEVLEAAPCGSCHNIPGVANAHGRIGPPLDFFSERSFIAGAVPNSPENLVQWILDPQSIEPGTAMPDVGLTDEQARDVAAYLYTLR